MADFALSIGLRWSSVSVIGSTLSRSIFTVAVAKLVGPEDFGIAAQATVYVGIVGLLLDQGFSSALIQRHQVESRMPGAVATVNLATGAVLTGLTIAIAPLWARFMGTQPLMLVLIGLSPSLLLRAAAVTPRAMLMRYMEFRRIAIADTVSAVVGGALGVIAALVGWGYWAIVVQLVATDALLLSVLLTLGAGWKPNIEFGLLRDIAGFSARAFGAGVLVNSVSRNVDNLLVGRFQGPQALAFYGLAYRLLLLPVQLANTTVGSVLFPVFSRLADDRVSLGVELRRATRILAVLFLPTMLLVSAAALQLVLLIFGRAWLPAVPIVQVLAVAGALQAIYQPSTSPLVLALGESRLNLRYAWLTTGTATIGFIAGLPFGPFGVAVGYTAATGLMVPVQWLIRRRLLGMTLRSQALSIIPGIHIAAWATAAYFAVSAIIPGRNLLILGIGTSVAAVVALVVLRFIHTPLWIEFLRLASRMIGRRGGLPKSQDGSSDLDNGASR